MSMRSKTILMALLATQVTGVDVIGYHRDRGLYTPPTGTKPKQTMPKWIVNGVTVSANTRKAAIKKARREYGAGFDKQPLTINKVT